MTGGSSLLYGLERYLYEETGIHIITAEDPLSCVAVGTGKVLEERKTLELVSSTITTRMI